MTSDALLVVQTLFSTIWRLFTTWSIPGTNTTPAAFFIFLLFASFVLRYIVKIITGAATVGSMHSRSVGGDSKSKS